MLKACKTTSLAVTEASATKNEGERFGSLVHHQKQSNLQVTSEENELGYIHENATA